MTFAQALPSLLKSLCLLLHMIYPVDHCHQGARTGKLVQAIAVFIFKKGKGLHHGSGSEMPLDFINR